MPASAKKTACRRRLRRQGHQPCRMGPQGKSPSPKTEMPGPDGDARGVRGPSSRSRARGSRARLQHDHPDRRADRDADRARRPTCAGPRATSIRRREPCGPRRSPPLAFPCSPSRARASSTNWNYNPAHPRMERRRRAEHDPRRRRRRDNAGASRPCARKKGDTKFLDGRDQRGGRGVSFALIKRHADGEAGLVRRARQEHPRRIGGDDHGRVHRLYIMEKEGKLLFPRDQTSTEQA